MMEKQKRTARILSLMLIITMLLPMAAGAVSVSDFRDVKSGDWFYSAVDFAVDAGLFNGKSDTVFAPNDPMTRGMFVTVLGRRVGVVTSGYPGTEFSDVSSSMYYAPYINWAYEHEIVSGTGNGKFSPDANITRQDLVTLIYRFMENPTLGEKALIQDALNYADYNSISGYAFDAMDWAFTNGVISGVSSTRLDPHGTATRAQVAQIFKNANEFFGDPLPQPTPEEPKDAQEMFETISAAYEGRLSELTAGGTEVGSDRVMEEMLTIAQELESEGYIENLEQTSEGIFYDYADGTSGGLIMELPEEDDGVSTLASYTNVLDGRISSPVDSDFAGDGSAEEPTAGLMADTNVIGNNNVFIGGYVNGNLSLANSYSGLKGKIDGSNRGHVVTNNIAKTTVDDFRNLYKYGAIFLTFPNVIWHNGEANIVLDQKFDLSTYDKKEYAEDRLAKRIGLYSVLSPQNPKLNPVTDGYILTSKRYEHNVAYVIFTKSFFESLPEFDHAYMHLGFQDSMSASAGLVRILMNKGVAAITGYDDLMRQSHDYKLVDLMLDVFLRDDIRAVSDADEAVIDAGLLRHKFTASYYKNTKWELEKKDVTCMMQLACTPQNSDLVLWPPKNGSGATGEKGDVYVTNASFYVEEPRQGVYDQTAHMTVTVRNDTDKPVTGMKLDIVPYFQYGYVGDPGGSNYSIFQLDNRDWETIPPHSEKTYQFEKAYSLGPGDIMYVEFRILEYVPEGIAFRDYENWVIIPEDKWVDVIGTN